jgi:hypothetical protein
MAYFKVVSQDSLGQTDENHKKPEQSICSHFYQMPS